MKPWDVVQFEAGSEFATRTVFDDRWLASFPPPPTQAPRAVVLCSEELERLKPLLRRFGLRDAGTKDRRKQLSRYVRSRDRLVALTTEYTDPGQAEHGLHALLKSLDRNRRGVLMLIGVPDPLFALLGARAVEEKGGPGFDLAGGTDQRHLRYLLNDAEDTVSDREMLNHLRTEYLGTSEQAEIVRRLILRAVRAECPVLIEGESGTGKDVVARQIHFLRHGRKEHFIPANCGGIPNELFESEMFGYVAGAFTGANKAKKGFFKLAEKGTLFLDELGDLSLYHQGKLLRAIEEKRIWPVGAVKSVRCRTQFVAATNRDLDRMIQTGQFRSDLYYRLFFFRIRTPTLRSHPEDIGLLANHFWGDIVAKGSRLPPDVIDALKAYAWPGNARELNAFLHHLYLLAEGRERRVNRRLLDTVMIERGQSRIFERREPDR